MLAFFHQNLVVGEQGGVERYLATMLRYGANRCLLILGSEAGSGRDGRVIYVALRGPSFLPRWLRFALGIVHDRKRLQEILFDEGVKLIEYSRPELLLVAHFFKGTRVVTMHGTGPQRGDTGKYLVHYASSLLIPKRADRIQIVGRDLSALSPSLHKRVNSRIVSVDAWFDGVFQSFPFPLSPPLRVFYAGRIAPQKNPDLLAKIMVEAKRKYTSRISFVYLGSDYSELEKRGCADIVDDLGLQSAAEVSAIISSCHAGLLCSAFGEGSPFIIAETLACGRLFVASPLPTIIATYSEAVGVILAKDWSLDAFMAALDACFDMLELSDLAALIADGVSQQHASLAVPRYLDGLEHFASNLR